MSKKAMPKSERVWVDETEADLKQLGFDPRSPEDWRRYAIVRYREHRLIAGVETPGDPETLEVNRRIYNRDRQLASLVRLLAMELQGRDKAFLMLRRPSHHDVLDAAVGSLEAISDLLAPLQICPFGGLPTPLQILIPELLNVREDRLSRLLTPSDRVVASAVRVKDSRKDYIRITVQAYAAAAVKRIIDSKRHPHQNTVYQLMADALTNAGFFPPGRNKTSPYSAQAIRAWYEQGLSGTSPQQQRYEQAVAVTPDDPDLSLELLATHVRRFQFTRAEKGAV
jgi:hypothetical protein